MWTWNSCATRAGSGTNLTYLGSKVGCARKERREKKKKRSNVSKLERLLIDRSILLSAISMLKDAAPGTFVVRDSNSFPGAFGLALKVATPPPGAPSSPRDPSSELVRHFLIEPTSRGVRLKGCANEPVFSSLSALVYQHSLMAMALPCPLLLPEPEAAARALDSPGTNSTQQLLAQGAGM